MRGEEKVRMCVQREKRKKALQNFHHQLNTESTESSLLFELSIGRGEEGRRENPRTGRGVTRDSPPTWHTHMKPPSVQNRQIYWRSRQKKILKYCTVTGFPAACGSMHFYWGLEIGNSFPRRSETAVHSLFFFLKHCGGCGGSLDQFAVDSAVRPCMPVWRAEGICCSLCGVEAAAEPKDAGTDSASTEEHMCDWEYEQEETSN